MTDLIRKSLAAIILWVLPVLSILAQLSPGDLSSPHSHLEGISNCTQCHELGNKQTNEKCLACHSEIKQRILARKGYHASSEVNGNQCNICHSEHNGKNFQLVPLDVKEFDHKLTGYPLSVPHSKKDCRDCHSSGNIEDPKLKAKKNTYLGVGTACLTCHADYHLRTLSSDCLNCHTEDSFVPASKFNHDNAKFRLAGKHRTLECVKCHKINVTDGKKFQQFNGIPYTNCASCHKDPHKNQFGQNCRQCHSEESFKVTGGMEKFDHNKTSFRLQGKHMIVNCRTCHKGKFTDPLKHDKCLDCHKDYHRNQFARNGIVPDCSLCHNVNGFRQFAYTIEQHNEAAFPLKGAHQAIPCYECHKKQDQWNFRNIGINCRDCHPDIHQNFISSKYYTETGCVNCHKETGWSDVTFDHNKTQFALTGAHARASCRSCHFRIYATGTVQQEFNGLSHACSDCHADKHHDQFDKNGVTNCTDCHGTDNWKASKFDHSKTAFRLDGKHINVPCAKCHKPQQEGSEYYVMYKIKDYRCEACHF